MLYTIQNIASIINGQLIQNNTHQNIIKHLLIDSRTITEPEDSLFFAIKGEHRDGHQFLSEAYEKGIRNFIISDVSKISNIPQSNIILVDDTLIALQKLASEHRKQFNIPVIGITGSNGKTIIKEWLFQLLSDDYNIVRSPKSYNSQVGVPLSVWQMNNEHQLAIFEAGISKSDEMENLQKIIQPSIGIFTNIGTAHDENFRTIGQKIQEKLKLFTTVETLIYCEDYADIHQIITSTYSSRHVGRKIKEREIKKDKIKLYTWSRFAKQQHSEKNPNLFIVDIVKLSDSTQIVAIDRDKNQKKLIRIPFTDDASIENAIHCWALMLYLGYDNETIFKRMSTISSVAMRLELKAGINNCTMINDSYNSDLVSLKIALDFLNQQNQHKRKTLILSDVLQTGIKDEILYREVAKLVKEKNVSRLIGIGSAIKQQSLHFSDIIEKSFYLTTDDFLTDSRPLTTSFRDEAILLKGARQYEFERISQCLQQKTHNTILEINLNAIVHNLNYYRSKLQPNTKLMAIVKAFSYGSGSYEIANLLQYHKTDYLAVAFVDEGVELRKAGIYLPILVLNPEEQSFELMINADLEPEIYSFRVLKLFLDAVKTNPSVKTPYPVHIEIDTGLHRLGFTKQDVPELIKLLKKNEQYVYIKSVFSHLASADNPLMDDFTYKQIALFKEITDKIIYEISDLKESRILRHILNSAGITRFPSAQFDMVRLGIGLYGIGIDDNEQKQLKNISTLKSVISQIKKVSPNEAIGYNRSYIAKKEMTIGIVPIGYADGLNRRLSNGRGKVIVNGRFALIVGNICMDMCMIDITDISAKEGDEVIIFGENYPITELAKNLETIPYEILTSISNRVKRVYFYE